MSREYVKSAELIKQRIDLYKEQLKFINSFYLPLVSGIVVLVFSHDPMPAGIRVAGILVGGLGICILTWMRFVTLDLIEALIKEL